MEQKVIKELTTNEILERLDEEKRQLVKLKLNHTVSPLENPNKIKAYRKTIARLETELRYREINGEKITKTVKI
ncbi:MAG: 50S ribosomal protein L29 [Bacteroidales bacterium]|nr:50S ribosomal protein L29 [Bacteroidales bacterium]NCA75357.1 50S ribosomal protein L29 [Alphaproteobacteria bacterium]HNW73860.1 50S ribosomal protein L29 [Bacteroidales bacterium]HPS50100.1 50S ribosomal protein L29 [Bacteroidales bacterium]